MTRIAPLGLHRCRLIRAAVVGSWLMADVRPALAQSGYVGLIWDRAPELSALFDSPDRLFGTVGHVLGLLAPEAEGANRIDGELLPLEPLKLVASRPVKASATIIGGKAASVVPAVMQYVGLKGLPQRPTILTLPEYVRLTASGWLDSPIRSGHRFRHAADGSFGAYPAADAAWMMDELAVLCTDPVLADRLKDRGGRGRRGGAGQATDSRRGRPQPLSGRAAGTGNDADTELKLILDFGGGKLGGC